MCWWWRWLPARVCHQHLHVAPSSPHLHPHLAYTATLLHWLHWLHWAGEGEEPWGWSRANLTSTRPPIVIRRLKQLLSVATVSRENNNSMDVIHFRWVHLYPCSPAVMRARAGTRRGGLAAAQLTADSSPVLGKIMDVLSVE